LSYLATKKAKPDGYFYLKESDAKNYIAPLNVKELPGLGYSVASKLEDIFNVSTCLQLRGISLKELTSKFGEQTAKRMFK